MKPTGLRYSPPPTVQSSRFLKVPGNVPAYSGAEMRIAVATAMAERNCATWICSGSVSASGLKSRKSVNEPLAPGFVHVFPPTCYRCPFGKTYPSCEITCATLVNDVIEMEDPSTVAAVMVEPIGHTGGIIDPPPGVLVESSNFQRNYRQVRVSFVDPSRGT